MGSAVTPSPLDGGGWGWGIARHSQIKGLFFKWIQRRAPLPNPPPNTHEGGGDPLRPIKFTDALELAGARPERWASGIALGNRLTGAPRRRNDQNKSKHG